VAVLIDSLTINFLEFIEVLKLAGVRVSISEILDAYKAMTYIDIMNKEVFKAAISTCIAKSEEEKAIFSEAFNRFFISSDLKTQEVEELIQKQETKKQEILKEISDLKFKGEQVEVVDELKEVYSNLDQNDKKSIVAFLDKTSSGKNVKNQFLPIVEQIIHSKLKSLKQNSVTENTIQRGAFSNVPSEAGYIAEQVVENIKRENSILYKNISEFNQNDISKALQLIKLFIVKYRRANSRYKKTNKKKRLDLKTTIRKNLNTGCVQFNLKYKMKPRKKDKYILLCDVSASMFKFSSFVLQFMLGMSSGNSLMETFIFSDGIYHINTRALSNNQSFEEMVINSPIWRKGTNISRSLNDLEDRGRAYFHSSIVYIIISDAKTVDAALAVEKLKSIRAKVKNILWFNPIPEIEWTRIKHIQGFKECCEIYDCSTLDKLERALDSKL